MNTETTPAPKEVPQPASGDALELCPFCKGKAAFVPRAVNLVLQKDPSDPKFGVSVICGRCGAESPNMVDEAHAAAAWNRRAASGAPQEAPAPTTDELAAMEYVDREIMLDQRDLRCTDDSLHDYLPTNEVYRGRLMYFRCRDCGHNSQIPF